MKRTNILSPQISNLEFDPKRSIFTPTPLPQEAQVIMQSQNKTLYQYIAPNSQMPMFTLIDQTPLRYTKESVSPPVKQAQASDKIEISEQEAKYNTLVIQYEECQGVAKNRLEEIEKWRQKYKRLEEQIATFSSIEQKVNALINENQQLKFDLSNLNTKLKLQMYQLQCSWANCQSEKSMIESQKNILLKEKSNMDSEIQRLKDYLEIKDNEINDYKKRIQEQILSETQFTNQKITDYEATISQKIKESHELKAKMQKITESELEGLKQIAQLEEVIIMLGAENERLHGIQKEKFKENEGLKKKVTSLEKSNLDLTTDTQKISEYDQLIAQLNDEQTQLRQQLGAYQQEINNSQIKYAEVLRQSKDKDQWQEEIEELKGEIDKKNFEIEQLKLKFGTSEKTIADQQKGLKQLAEFEQRLTNLQNENNRLQLVITQKQEQLNSSNQKLQTLEKRILDGKQWEATSQRLEQNVMGKDGEIEALKNKLAQFEGKLSTFQQYEVNMAKKYTDYESTLTQAQDELVKLESQLQIKAQENEELKSKSKALDLQNISQGNEINALKYKLTNIEEKNEGLGQEVNRLLQLVQQKMDEANEYKKKYRESDNNYNELQNASRSIKGEVAELRDKIAIYETEIQRLYGLLKDRDTALNQSRDKVSQSELELANLRYQLTELQQLSEFQKKELAKTNELLNQQLEQASNQKSANSKFQYELQNYQADIKELNEKLARAEGKIAKLQPELEKSLADVNQLKRQLEEEKQNNSVVDDLKKKQLGQSESIDSLEKKLKDKENENNEIKKKLQKQNESIEEIRDELGKEISKKEAYENKVKQIMEQKGKLEQFIEELKKVIETQSTKLKKIDEYQKQFDELNQKINELQLLKSMLSDKDDKLKANKDKITLLESQVKDLEYFTDRAKDFEGKNQVLNNEINRLKFEFQQARQQLKDQEENFKQTKQDSDELTALKKQIEQLKQKNAKLESELQVMMQYENKLSDLTLQLQSVNNDNSELKNKFNENQALYERSAWMAQEIQRLTILLNDKEQELSSFKAKYIENSELMKQVQDHLVMFMVLFAEIESLRDRLDQKEKEQKEARRTGYAKYQHQKTIERIDKK